MESKNLSKEASTGEPTPQAAHESDVAPRSSGSNAMLAVKVFVIAALVFAALWYLNRASI